MRDYIHLHVHTQYSLLDGQTSIDKMIDKAVYDGMRGVAITDHGSMMGVKEFYNVCKKKNKRLKEEGKHIKPIIGCEVYVAPRDKEMREGRQDAANYHLILLAKNLQGYRNLVKIVSRAWTEGFYSHARTDKKDLERYHEGLICCSACLGGEIPKLIAADRLNDAEETALWFKSIFGDDYYIELQRHKATVLKANHETYRLQQQVNEELVKLARKLGIKLVATNDVHFLDEENADAHELLICLNTGKSADDPTLMRYTKQEWFKTRQEMNAIFEDLPESLDASIEILDKIEEYSIDNGPIMPNFDIPKEFGTEEDYRRRFTPEELFKEFTCDEHGREVLSREDAESKIAKLGGCEKLYRIKLEADYLRELTLKGAKVRYGDPIPDDVMELLTFELHIMKTMGFPGYFLIVQDFISAARNILDVSVGPGRGSAAGSAVAYCLGITQIDPIKYDLLFERFLNPDRISLPDIDVDFDEDGRGRVLQWVTEKYGKEKVAHIITYGTMATKMALKDVGRVLNVKLDVVNALCKAIPDKLPDKPDGTPRKMNIQNVLECIPEFKQAMVSEDENLRLMIQYAKMLEGNVRNTGVHACGTIICRDDITDWVPVSVDKKSSNERQIVTQYEGGVIEETGLIKMDFLGLKTLSIIKEAVANVKQSLGIDIDIDNIPIDDKKTFQLYSEGRTIGTFQFESPGMQKHLRELQPGVFEDLIAMNALYRPGPMDYIPDFIDRKLGRKPIEYDIPCMEKYLKDTYGITVYQEQVMLLSRLLANFTRGESDTLRKAMGKKMKDKLDQLKPKFINGGQANGHNPEVLEKIWSDWEKFASYAFNKSHATCYSWVAYQTAYLKANYPAHYMAATLSRNLSNQVDIIKLMGECKAMGIKVLGPDVNESFLSFAVNADGNIRFGMAAIKGVGENAVQAIINERNAAGPYSTIFDFVQRVNLSACNKKCIEFLALAGAFDTFTEVTREQIVSPYSATETYADRLVKYGMKYQADKMTTANSLFGDLDAVIEIATPKPPEVPQWSALARLNLERERVGMYISGHPLDEYKVIVEKICNTQPEELKERSESLIDRDIIVAGIVTECRERMTKKSEKYGVVTIENYTGNAGELALYGKSWLKWEYLLKEGNFVLIRATCSKNKYSDKIYIDITSVELLQDVKDSIIKGIEIKMPLESIDRDFVDNMCTLLSRRGNVELIFKIDDYNSNESIDLLSSLQKFELTEELLQYLDTVSGVTYKINS